MLRRLDKFSLKFLFFKGTAGKVRYERFDAPAVITSGLEFFFTLFFKSNIVLLVVGSPYSLTCLVKATFAMFFASSTYCRN